MKISGQDIICFAGEDWWMHNPHSNLHLMQSFSKNNRVLFVNSIGVRSVVAKSGSFWNKALRKAGSFARYFKQVQENIYVLSPLALPVLKGHEKWIRAFNSKILQAQVSRALRKLKMKDYLLWVCSPVAHDAALSLRDENCKALVYYCVDNVAYVDGVIDETIASWDSSLQQKADVAFFVNHELVEQRRSLNPNTFHLGHGVDYDHFSKAQRADGPLPGDMADIKRPVIGYMGAIRDLDTLLISALARACSDLSFVFIGDIGMDVSSLQNLPNVHFLGRRAYADLPDYLRTFDCCCLFYKGGDEFNAYRNPKKLIEYFATGKPVITVTNHEMRRFSELIILADTVDEYEQAIRTVLRGGSEEARRKRIEYARAHTWDAICAQASGYIANILKSRKTD